MVRNVRPYVCIHEQGLGFRVRYVRAYVCIHEQAMEHVHANEVMRHRERMM